MKAVLFHNPKSGKKGQGKDEVLAALKLADHSARYVSTKSDDLKKELAEADADFVVVAGGDGTVAEVIANLGNRKLPIGILPMGTANNIARSLEIGGEPQVLVESWNLEKTRRLDVGVIDGTWGKSPFVESFGLGLLPDMILKANKKSKGKGALNLKQGRELLRQLTHDAKRLDLKIMIDGKALDGEWLGVEVMNIPFTGPGLHLAPKADFSDGMLELVCFEKKQADELCEWFDAPAERAPPALTRRGKLITLTWKDAPHRVDDESSKAEDKTKVVTIRCEEEQALILETRLKPELQAAAQMEAAQ
jgi:diacylglycerol kinase family enzyme